MRDAYVEGTYGKYELHSIIFSKKIQESVEVFLSFFALFNLLMPLPEEYVST